VNAKTGPSNRAEYDYPDPVGDAIIRHATGADRYRPEPFQPHEWLIAECTVCGYKTIRVRLNWHCGQPTVRRQSRRDERIVLFPWPQPGPL
jgi:hypothetical protein